MEDIQIIKNWYCNQTAVIKEGRGISDGTKIRSGLRQGCILFFLNVYSDEIIQTALEDESSGIKVTGKVVNNIMFKDKDDA